jgi:hypothetical protein
MHKYSQGKVVLKIKKSIVYSRDPASANIFIMIIMSIWYVLVGGRRFNEQKGNWRYKEPGAHASV